MSLRAGDWVEVRSQSEILATLDEGGRLDSLPFMPEMLQYCGRRFRVWKRAHKTCDTATHTGGRRMSAAVHLEELRCDGSAHRGCDSACLLFWKEAWLRPIAGPDAPSARSDSRPTPGSGGLAATGCSERQLLAATTRSGDGDGQEPLYRCQATDLPSATTLLKWWDIRQYVEDYTSGNVPLRQLFAGAVYVTCHTLITASQRYSTRLSRLLIRLYDGVQHLRRGTPYPRLRGTIPRGQRTPAVELGLGPGDVVRVRPYKDILGTLDGRNRNRGMLFDAEEVPYCGGTFRVRSRARRIIDESSGRMITLQGRNVLLEGAWCQARYSDRRMFCPRAIFPIWREVWLERTDGAPPSDPGAAPRDRAP